jgi:hypothetical protein
MKIGTTKKNNSQHTTWSQKFTTCDEWPFQISSSFGAVMMRLESRSLRLHTKGFTLAERVLTSQT